MLKVGLLGDCWMRASAMPGIVRMRLEQLVGVGEVRLEIGAADLQVDRRRRAEIQDLADDVGRQEREGHAGKHAAADCSRSARTYSAVGRWPSFSLIWMSPSCGPITPVLL